MNAILVLNDLMLKMHVRLVWAGDVAGAEGHLKLVAETKTYFGGEANTEPQLNMRDSLAMMMIMYLESGISMIFPLIQLPP